ncbi:MAG: M28 family peptidase [Pseudomonadota bacterium]
MRLLPLLLLAACRPDADTTPDDTAPPAPGVPDEARLLAHVATLASEAYGGREPGTPGGELAAAYVEAHYQGLGLAGAGDDGGFRRLFDLQRFVVQAPPTLALDGQALAEPDDFQLFTWSGAGQVEAEVVFVGYGLTVPPFDPAVYPGCPLNPEGYDDYQDLDLGGKVALVARHGPSDDDAINDRCPVNEAGQADGDLFTFGYKAANAAQHGASAMLLFTDYVHPEGPAEAGTVGEGYYQPELPAFFVDRGVLEAHLPELEAWAAAADAGPAPVETGLHAALSADTGIEAVEVPNVLAEIPGDGSTDEVVVVGAHFDHLGTGPGGEIYYGADDNASGTAVVLELAELFMGWGVQPRRTVVFAAFNAEELGLIGSMRYIIDPPHPLADTVAMVNLDMVGGGDEQGVIDFGGLDEGSEWLYDLMVAHQDEAFPVTPLGSSPNSDHAFFQLAGVPVAFLFTVGVHPTYHSPEDTFDTISGWELQQTARLTWDVVRELAMAQEAPAQARVLPPPIAEPVRRPAPGRPTR